MNLQYFKISLIFIIAIFASIQSMSQEYRPMNFENGVWLEEYFEKGGYEERCQKYCMGDSTVNNQLYYKLYETKVIYNPPGYFPDTVIGSYLGLIGNFNDKTIGFIPKDKNDPIIIYDFNLNLGDTIHGVYDNIIINEIDSIEICGEYHKRYIQDTCCMVDPRETLVEGVGFSNGLLGWFNIFDQGGETTIRLECYSDWGNQECSSCDFILKVPSMDLEFQIFPNPIHDKLIFQSSRPIIKVQVYDILGNLLFTKTYAADYYDVLEFDHLNQNMYVFKVQFADHSFHSVTILKD